MNFEMTYQTYQPLLHSIAYRMLGSISDAEDIVQDVFVQFERLQKDQITNPKAYLIKMITNHSLNYLHSARKKREVYMGTWLPEPQISPFEQNPLEQMIKDESISYGLLLLMEQLTAIERAVFILRESLAYDYPAIAELLDKTETNCRKIYSRAKAKIHAIPTSKNSNTAHLELVNQFMYAAKSGDFQGLITMLTEGAQLLADGGGKVRSAIFPIISRERVIAFLQGVIPKGFLGEDHRLVQLNGQPGILILQGNQPHSTISFELDSKQTYIQKIYVVSNPDKLLHIEI